MAAAPWAIGILAAAVGLRGRWVVFMSKTALQPDRRMSHSLTAPLPSPEKSWYSLLGDQQMHHVPFLHMDNMCRMARALSGHPQHPYTPSKGDNLWDCTECWVTSATRKPDGSAVSVYCRHVQHASHSLAMCAPTRPARMPTATCQTAQSARSISSSNPGIRCCSHTCARPACV